MGAVSPKEGETVHVVKMGPPHLRVNSPLHR